MSDPWFQPLFADRIGGANYGKGTEIYKFEKIKRAKRAGPGRPPRAAAARLRHRRERRHGRPASSATRSSARVDKLENRGYADNGIPAFKEAAAGFMKQHLRRRRSTRPRRSTTAIGSKPALAMLPAVLHQPRRRDADDRARLPRRRHAHALLRRRGPQAAAAARRTASIPDLDGIPADVRKRAKLLVINYPNSPTGARRDARLLPAGDRLRPRRTRSSSCRTRPTSC